jgi:thiamine pyrophosphokinase
MKQIKFGNRQFDAVICLNASLPDIDIFRQFAAIQIIAADGSAEELFKLKIIPDLIIGDMDSLDLSTLPSDFDNSHLKIIEDQETNDFEKILNYCFNSNLNNLLITGIHGGELEHTLNNLSVYKKFNKVLNLCIFDFDRYGILIDSSILLNTISDETISLVPFPAVNIKTTNLKWALNNEDLILGKREGARNKALSNNIQLEINSGELFVFFTPRLPFAPEFKDI